MFFRRRQIIGIDIGTSCAKAVVLDYGAESERMFIREYATLPLESEDQPLAETLMRLLRKLRTRCRECAVSAWPSGARVRLFDRATDSAAAYVRGSQKAGADLLFHEELNDYVTECGPVGNLRGTRESSMLVASGIPRPELNAMESALRKLRYKLVLLQLTPIAILNAFTDSHADAGQKDPFLLVDLGRTRTTIIGGCHGIVRLMRVVENPWGEIAPAPPLNADGSVPEHDEDSVPGSVTEAAELMVQEILPVREYLQALDEMATLRRIHISGALSSHTQLIRLLDTTFDIRCVQWNPFRQVVARNKAIENFMLLNDLAKLPAAAGAAFQCAR